MVKPLPVGVVFVIVRGNWKKIWKIYFAKKEKSIIIAEN
jgi:hypothetical protein